MRVESVFIDEINIGERRREDYGDLEGLANSIAKFGLLQPIVIDAGMNLVAGGRRVAAFQKLGRPEIDARFYSELTEDERRELELEENLQRKDLTPFEASRQLVTKAEKVAPIISVTMTEKKSGETRGRKSQHQAPREDIANAVGVSEATLRRAEEHVEAVIKYPELSVVPTQKGAIETAKKLDKMPARERDAALSRIATEGKQAAKDITRKPSPSKRSKSKPASGKYATSLSQIQVFISSIQSVGAEELTANWTERETQEFLENLREARDGMSSIVSGLESVQRERRQANEAA